MDLTPLRYQNFLSAAAADAQLADPFVLGNQDEGTSGHDQVKRDPSESADVRRAHVESQGKKPLVRRIINKTLTCCHGPDGRSERPWNLWAIAMRLSY